MSYLWWLRMLDYLATGRAHNAVTYVGFLASNVVLNGLNVLWFYQIVGGGKSKGHRKQG